MDKQTACRKERGILQFYIYKHILLLRLDQILL